MFRGYSPFFVPIFGTTRVMPYYRVVLSDYLLLTPISVPATVFTFTYARVRCPVFLPK